MKLRSGTMVTTDNVKKGGIVFNKYDKFSRSVKQKLEMCEKYPCSKSIKNLKYIMCVYVQIDEEFFELLKDEIPVSVVILILIMYKKTLELMSDLIGKTYDKKSAEYDSSIKEMIVKLLYKMRTVFTRLRRIMYDIEEGSKYIKDLLNECVENAGKLIDDKNSTKALAYYCYSHLYGNDEINRYAIHTYEDGEYSYEEIYDYYFGDHINKNIEDDMFIRDDYKYWFTYKATTDKYHLYGYKRHALKPLYTFNELKSRIEYYKDEIYKYYEMMEEMYPEMMEEILYRQREQEEDE